MLRAHALAAYREFPWPSSSRDEDWRRTPQIDRFDPSSLDLPEALGGELRPYLKEVVEGPLSGSDVEALVVVDQRGNLDFQGPSQPWVKSLADGLKAEPQTWESVLGRIAAPGLRKSVAMNAVRTNGGACVHVAKGQSPDGYVRLVQGADRRSGSFPRNLIRLDEGSRLVLLEEWVSPDDDPSFLAPVTEVELGRGAQLVHVIRQACGNQAVLQSTVRVHVGQEAQYHARWMMFGTAWQKSYHEVMLMGEGSETDLTGLALCRGSQHCDVQTLQDHAAPGAESNLLHRVAVADRSRSVFAGLIRVEEHAQKTNAYVQNRNLLLGSSAKADSIPTLEILANDVRCTHGSTAGRIDEEQLFYCYNRGIEREQAKRLIVEGFFNDVVDAIPAGSLREANRELVLEGLAQLIRRGALEGEDSAA